MLDSIEQHESNVRGYVRLFPTVFDVARGSELWDTDGCRFIDFFCGAGTLNYGHNNPMAKTAIVNYVQRDGVQHALDTATAAKIDFLTAFDSIILKPRGLNYKIQFTGPTGTNAVEAAVKLAKQVTRRSHVVAFTGGYHGHSLGSLALTANSYYHSEYFGSHNNVSHLPFDGYYAGLDSAALLQRMISDSGSGIPLPAAIILETVQGEGGINVASVDWLQRVQQICRDHNILLIVDDIQVGNGRTGTFFSFEQAGLTPDMVCLSKSIGGGLPMSIVLIDSRYDQWKSGQHTGTFRGNTLAFVAATALLDHWRDDVLASQIENHQRTIHRCLKIMATQHTELAYTARGRGMIQGLDVGSGETAAQVIRECFANGLLLEACGADDQVLKVMPALTISESLLSEGLQILENAVAKVTGSIDPDHPPLRIAAICNPISFREFGADLTMSQDPSWTP